MAAAAAAIHRVRGSTSAIATFLVSGSHDFTIHQCSTSRMLPPRWCLETPTFAVAGVPWRVMYHPNGRLKNDGDYISLYLAHNPARYVDNDYTGVAAEFKFTLLDTDGNPVPRYAQSSQGLRPFPYGLNHPSCRVHGVEEFITWKDLVMSGCLEDDHFTVRCDITLLKGFGNIEVEGHADAGPAAAALTDGVAALPSLHQHLHDLLWTKEGADVTFDVHGETLEAHRWLLAARSPVLREELLAATKEKASIVEINGMEPEVFRRMLHFMYTDALPPAETEEEEQDTEGLLAAAHRYKLDKLKLMCGEKLRRRIDVGTVAGTLAVAEQNSCGALKAACVEFMTRPGNLKAVMQTEGFEKIKATCPSVLLEILIKQVA